MLHPPWVEGLPSPPGSRRAPALVVVSKECCVRNPVPSRSAEQDSASRRGRAAPALAPTTARPTSCRFHANAHPSLAPSRHGVGHHALVRASTQRRPATCAEGGGCTDPPADGDD